MASDFLETACTAPAGAAFAAAWLAHEERHWDFYESVYYRDAEAGAERAILAEGLGQRRDETCGQARMFLASAPVVLDAQRERVARLVGAAPARPVAFAAALQSTDGCVRTYRGRSYLIFNARHDTFARTTGLVVTLAHELIHDAQGARYGDRDENLPPAARTLYREGAAVFGIQVLFPEIRQRATGLKPEQLEQAQRVVAHAADDLLALIREGAPDEKTRRFFQGGFQDPVYPPKMGYFLGALVFQKIAGTRGNEGAVRMSPEDFGRQAERILAELADGGTSGAGSTFRRSRGRFCWGCSCCSSSSPTARRSAR